MHGLDVGPGIQDGNQNVVVRLRRWFVVAQLFAIERGQRAEDGLNFEVFQDPDFEDFFDFCRGWKSKKE
jgi:hypothetical protein